MYGILAKAIATTKKKNPKLLFGGALAAQEINIQEHDPLTGEIIPADKTWQMALDPQAHGLTMTKQQLHEAYWKKAGSRKYLLPDITNANYHRLLLNMAKRQIDAGVDAIWIDGLFVQAGVLARQTRDVSHPAVDAAARAAGRLVDEIHRSGQSKGRSVSVGSWPYDAYYTHGLAKSRFPALDFVTVSPTPAEVRRRALDEERWEQKIKRIRDIYGTVPIVAFIDWAFTTDTPLSVFSQQLGRAEACQALRNLDRFFRRHGIIFAYPLHGGFLGHGARRLAFGRRGKYDALAPEFATYETIKQLAAERNRRR